MGRERIFNSSTRSYFEYHVSRMTNLNEEYKRHIKNNVSKFVTTKLHFSFSPSSLPSPGFVAN